MFVAAIPSNISEDIRRPSKNVRKFSVGFGNLRKSLDIFSILPEFYLIVGGIPRSSGDIREGSIIFVRFSDIFGRGRANFVHLQNTSNYRQ